MSDYTKTYDGAAKDASEAVLSGAEFDTEFAAISTAIASKLDSTEAGNLVFDATAAERKVLGYNGTNQVSMKFGTNGDWTLYDEANASDVISYDISETKLIAYENIEFDTSSSTQRLLFNTGSKVSQLYGTAIGDIGFYDDTNVRDIWWYDESNNYFRVAPSLILDGPVLASAGIKDEDNMASNSATALATQQSIKAYVDNLFNAHKVVSAYVLGTGSLVSGTTGISTSKIATGRYRITHNFGTSNYAVAATISGGITDRLIFAANKIPDSVDIYVYDQSAAGYLDNAFHVMIQKHS